MGEARTMPAMTGNGTDGPGLTPDAARNSAVWDAFSDEYQAKHAEALDWRSANA